MAIQAYQAQQGLLPYLPGLLSGLGPLVVTGSQALYRDWNNRQLVQSAAPKNTTSTVSYRKPVQTNYGFGNSIGGDTNHNATVVNTNNAHTTNVYGRNSSHNARSSSSSYPSNYTQMYRRRRTRGRWPAGGRAKFRGRRTGYGRRRVGLYGRSWGTTKEKKFLDTVLTHTPTNDNLWERAIDSLNNLPQGAGVSDRLGEKVTLTTIGLNFDVYVNGVLSTGDETDPKRVCIALVLDKQSNGTGGTVVAGDIFENTQSASSFLNMENSHRFKVLRRWDVILNSHYLGATTGHEIGYDSAMIKVHKKCKIPIMQSGATATLAAIKSNNISVWMFSSSSGPGGVHKNATMNGRARVRYVDA